MQFEKCQHQAEVMLKDFVLLFCFDAVKKEDGKFDSKAEQLYKGGIY
jgi:hypothetical protein